VNPALVDLFVTAFATLFVVIDPPGCAPIYSSLTAGASARQRNGMAVRSILIAGGVLIVFAFFGRPLLEALGISLDAFRVAGGIMLFMIALEMVFEKRTERRETRVQEMNESDVDDVSVFPMGIPMIAGPGSIAALMLLMSQTTSFVERSVVFGALFLVLLLTLAALLLAGPMLGFIGQKMEAMLTRLLGVILAALAAQFVLDGLRASFLA
jgi:multiple antibiotic resistance protein|tara:strand:- start:66130 stop:66762 length:633 start_codon:yes stop_codon:yes gene_type:complete